MVSKYIYALTQQLFQFQFRMIQMVKNSSSYSNQRISDTYQQPSKILLVCVCDTIAFQVTNQAIHQKFYKFGVILKILIFEKGAVTKLFVQFEALESAIKAKEGLDGGKLMGSIGKINIYYSTLNNLSLKSESSIKQINSQNSSQEILLNEYQLKYNNLTKSFKAQQNKLIDDDDFITTAFSPLSLRSKTDNPKSLQQQINQINKYNYSNTKSKIQLSNFMINQQEQIDMFINKNINNLLQINCNKIQTKIMPIHCSNNNHKINSKVKIKNQISRQSCSILSFNIRYSIKIKFVYNLFSNFGNISFISIKNRKVYVKYRTVQYLAIASSYLQGLHFSGSILNFQYPQDQLEAYPKESQSCQCTFYTEADDRFSEKRSLTVNAPSDTLHVSSIKKQICNEDALFDIFDKFGRVINVKILCYSNEKNMALVKFESLQDSCCALAELHNEIFSGRKMQISFTKSKI